MENITNQATGTTENVRQEFETYFSEGEDYVRGNPSRAILAAVGFGFILAQLPIRALLFSIIRLTLVLLRPALMIFGAYKLVEQLRDGQQQQLE